MLKVLDSPDFSIEISFFIFMIILSGFILKVNSASSESTENFDFPKFSSISEKHFSILGIEYVSIS